MSELTVAQWSFSCSKGRPSAFSPNVFVHRIFALTVTPSFFSLVLPETLMMPLPLMAALLECNSSSEQRIQMSSILIAGSSGAIGREVVKEALFFLLCVWCDNHALWSERSLVHNRKERSLPSSFLSSVCS